jgi:hypothetical protein
MLKFEINKKNGKFMHAPGALRGEQEYGLYVYDMNLLINEGRIFNCKLA